MLHLLPGKNRWCSCPLRGRVFVKEEKDPLYILLRFFLCRAYPKKLHAFAKAMAVENGG
jgi:hypothetical protein